MALWFREEAVEFSLLGVLVHYSLFGLEQFLIHLCHLQNTDYNSENVCNGLTTVPNTKAQTQGGEHVVMEHTDHVVMEHTCLGIFGLILLQHWVPAHIR